MIQQHSTETFSYFLLDEFQDHTNIPLRSATRTSRGTMYHPGNALGVLSTLIYYLHLPKC